ncbi:hypothetical protein KPH14_011428 [Odynerus spinipes]|uniref:Neurotransmitter-gated ion-channel ligand-binding domain-containing protein n=1 Tax=Odynerus spinipes TaxID=1348599 RepID=A0AAD9RWH2_9HYME|nr:hypothetical protein KPH14_011428 [Odynerus spinipes]
MMPPIIGETLRVWFLSALVVHGAVAGNPDAKRLYDDLLSNYNKLVRPVVNTSDVLRVCIKLKLSQLIDVNLKNQIMTTNLWVEQTPETDEPCKNRRSTRTAPTTTPVLLKTLAQATASFIVRKAVKEERKTPLN